MAADIAQYRAIEGPWAPLHLVVPNPCVKQSVLEGLARGLRVVTNQTTYYLEGFWRRNLPRTDPPIQLLDRTMLQGLLLSLLQDRALLEEPDLLPLKHYLAAEPRELKALQLATEVAGVFEAYLLGRPAWAPLWEQGKPAAEKAPEALEAWQRRLWRELRTRLKAASGRRRVLTFPEYLKDPAFDLAPFPKDVFIYGLGPMARTYHEAFRKLGRRCEARFYLWNPSREPWDDVRKEWAQPADSDDPFNLETRGHLALRRWGRPGREHIREVLQLTETDPRADEAAPEPVTLLEHLQHSIITLGTEGEPSLPPGPDDSIRIHACTGMRREAEVVASAIWQTILDGQGTLRFSDLAVVLPDASKADYLEQLRVAFANHHDLPWVLADEAPGLLQQTVEATLLLLGLARTDFTRAEVVCALTHPAVLARWPELRLDNLAEYCDRAGIVIRWNAEDTQDTDQEGGLWTWERGLRRTALGHFLGPVEGALEPPPALPTEGSPELTLFLRAFLQDLRQLATQPRTPGAWVPRLRTFLQAYLGYPAGAATEDENQALAKVMQALAGLRELEVPGLAPPLLGFREVLVLVGEALTALLAEPLGRSGRGVRVATHNALRGVPFHTRFLMGLGEGSFPGTATRNPMDLRDGKRQPGDISRAEQDRYLFLESLMASRQALVLSYVCRDAVTREALQPSPVLLDLRDLLVPALGAEGWRQLTLEHPHHRHHLAYFPHLTGGKDAALAPNHCGSALKEAQALWLGQSLRAAADRVDLPGDLGQWHLPAGERQALEAWLGETETLPEPAAAADRIRITFAQLRAWLECQIQGGASLRLGLQAVDEEDPASLAEEPVDADHRALSALRKATLWEALGAKEAPRAALERLHRLQLEAARMPGGFLFSGQREQALAIVEGWRGLLKPQADPVRHRFGSDRSGRRMNLTVEAHEPITLAVPHGDRNLRVQLEGMTEPLLEGWTLLLSTKAPPAGNPDLKDRVDLLRAWVDHLVMAAAGLDTPVGARVLAWDKDARKATAWERALAPVPQAEALAQLTAWVGEALNRPGWTLMPLEGVLAALAEPKKTASPGDWLEQERHETFPSFKSLYGPLPRIPLDEDTELEKDWRPLSEKRLGAFIAWVQTPEAAR